MALLRAGGVGVLGLYGERVLNLGAGLGEALRFQVGKGAPSEAFVIPNSRPSW